LATELRELGVGAVTVQAELEDSAEVASIVQTAADQLGPLDILVNNASTFQYDDLESLQPETFERTLRVNALAPLILSREFASQVPETGGVIVNLLDQKLANPNPDYLSYTTSKHALAGLTRSLSMGLAPSIRVNGISPGLTLPSPHASQAAFEEMHGTTPLERGSTPEDVASAVLFLVGAKTVTGEVIHVDGGEHLAPRASDVLYGRGD
jgi:NAD(P)-dependent dehydrogenase (short-subunit alcohol dehydrogenase family)